jgi:hypothetical protein
MLSGRNARGIPFMLLLFRQRALPLRTIWRQAQLQQTLVEVIVASVTGIEP